MEELYLTIFKGTIKALWSERSIFAMIFAPILLVGIGKLIYLRYEMKRLARSGINEIDQMDGKTFEKYLEVLFKKLEYRVERTRYVGDYGADLVTVKDGVKTVIQAKRYKKNVGVKAVQEAVAAKGYYGCVKAMVVCNSFYTKQAVILAKSNGVILWDRNDLVKALLSVNGDEGSKTAKEVSAVQDLDDHEDKAIPVNNICIICGETVSDKVRQYCLDHPERFGGQVYCFQHQKGIKGQP